MSHVEMRSGCRADSVLFIALLLPSSGGQVPSLQSQRRGMPVACEDTSLTSSSAGVGDAPYSSTSCWCRPSRDPYIKIEVMDFRLLLACSVLSSSGLPKPVVSKAYHLIFEKICVSHWAFFLPFQTFLKSTFLLPRLCYCSFCCISLSLC